MCLLKARIRAQSRAERKRRMLSQNLQKELNELERIACYVRAGSQTDAHSSKARERAKPHAAFSSHLRADFSVNVHGLDEDSGEYYSSVRRLAEQATPPTHRLVRLARSAISAFPTWKRTQATSGSVSAFSSWKTNDSKRWSSRSRFRPTDDDNSWSLSTRGSHQSFMSGRASLGRTVVDGSKTFSLLVALEVNHVHFQVSDCDILSRPGRLDISEIHVRGFYMYMCVLLCNHTTKKDMLTHRRTDAQSQQPRLRLLCMSTNFCQSSGNLTPMCYLHAGLHLQESHRPCSVEPAGS